MRTLLTTLALAASLFTMAQSADVDDDDKKTPEERAKHRTEVMTKQLGLSEDQSAKVLVINQNYMKTMESVKQLPREEDRKNRGRVIKEKRDQQLQGVLTADQYTKLVALRDKKREEKKGDKKEGKKGTHQE